MFVKLTKVTHHEAIFLVRRLYLSYMLLTAFIREPLVKYVLLSLDDFNFDRQAQTYMSDIVSQGCRRLGLNFINVLCTAFTLADSKTVSCQSFLRFWDLRT